MSMQFHYALTNETVFYEESLVHMWIFFYLLNSFLRTYRNIAVTPLILMQLLHYPNCNLNNFTNIFRHFHDVHANDENFIGNRTQLVSAL